jgi:hypothetical protein
MRPPAVSFVTIRRPILPIQQSETSSGALGLWYICRWGSLVRPFIRPWMSERSRPAATFSNIVANLLRVGSLLRPIWLSGETVFCFWMSAARAWV